MFGHYLSLALRSVKRGPWITLVMVLSIGVGVALAMASWTLAHLMSGDPIPQKSAEIYFPTIDVWGPAAHNKTSSTNEPPNTMDYGTVEALLRDHRATYQSAVYAIEPAVIPSASGLHPFSESGFAVTAQFFPMLNVPFEYGAGWNDADDAARAQVVVISGLLNDRLFGGGNSVGKTFGIGGRNYRVVGVLGNWDPKPSFYAVPLTGALQEYPPGVFVPFSSAIAAEMPNAAGDDCFKSPTGSGFASLLSSSCVWISYIVQLDSTEAARRYEDYLEGIAQQRFAWRPNVRLYGLMAWLRHLRVTQSIFRLLSLIGIGLLIVCLVDTIGLMLAKFMRRAPEIGVRRALGARRIDIYAQFLTEGALVGLGGGVLGVVLTILAMYWMRARMPVGWQGLTDLHVGLLVLTLGIAIVATLFAALYPAWRAAHIQPAIQIKSN